MWNKARLSYDGKHVHITCAGLPRPIGQYTVETFLDELIANGYPPEKVMQEVLGFNTYVEYEISHTLEHHRPTPQDIFDEDVTDYLGNTTHVYAHESIALYPSGHFLGETLKLTNRLSVEYLEEVYGREVDTTNKCLSVDAKTGKARLLKDLPEGTRVVMRG
jgi:hypothetical protein